MKKHGRYNKTTDLITKVLTALYKYEIIYAHSTHDLNTIETAINGLGTGVFDAQKG